MEEFQELVSAVQLIMNSRPIAWAAEGRSNEPHLITLEMFLLHHGKTNSNPNPYKYGPEIPAFYDFNAHKFEKQVNIQEQTKKVLWETFADNYLVELRKRRGDDGQKTDESVQVGHVVLYKPASAA